MIRRYHLLCCVFVWLAATIPTSALAKIQIVVVIGAAGEPQFGDNFREWATQWKSIAEKADAEITTIGIQTEVAIGDETSDRDRLQQTILQSVKSNASALWLVMIGHGTYFKEDSKFNLRGPDVSAKDLSEWLSPFTKPLVLINGASASGPFINQLSGKNRIILTATKSGTEDNYARFSGYFAKAIVAANADLDHDDEVSLLEAFLLASSQTQAFYADDGRISTEHALIDDNADGLGTPATMFDGVYASAPKDKTKQADGRIASHTVLIPSMNSLALTPEEIEQRAAIESQLDRLRNQRKSLDNAEFETRLEELLRPLAKIYHEAELRAK